MFDNVFKLVGVPVCTVQLRYAGWVTELADAAAARNPDQARRSALRVWAWDGGSLYDCGVPHYHVKKRRGSA